MMPQLYTIGIGYKPLDKRAKKIILNAQVILASKRLFEVFKRYEDFILVKDKVLVINNVDETINYIKSAIRCQPSDRINKTKNSELKTPNSKLSTIALLASGDPMFFGIGRKVVNEFGKDIIEIIPDLSSVSVALSKIKEPWDNIYFVTLHGGSGAVKRKLKYQISDIPKLLLQHEKIAILTDKTNNPSEIAKVLNLSPIADSLSPVMYVCEKLGYPDEKIITGIPKEIAGMSFKEPNVVIIQRSGVRSQESGVLFGLTEDEISHSRGLITKDEVRAVAIHKLRLPKNGVLWDIGAGSGSISIEASRLSPCLKIYAVEKDEAEIKNIKTNKSKFNAFNVEIIEGRAPEALSPLPSPDRVFIGGSGEKLGQIIKSINEKMPSGIIVINAATIETMNKGIGHLEKGGFSVDITQVSIARSKHLKGKNHLSSINPVFIISGKKV